MSSQQETLLYLIRHGQTEWNQAGRIQGHTESDLTKLGKEQAASAASILLELSYTYHQLYCSDLSRAQQTAEIIGEQLGLTAQLNAQLREMNFGDLEGLTRAEAQEKVPEIANRLWGEGSDPDFAAPNGESRQQMPDRGRGALLEIVQKHPGEKVVVVSHGGVIGYFLRSVLSIPMNVRPPFRTENAAVNIFSYRKERFKLITWGMSRPNISK